MAGLIVLAEPMLMVLFMRGEFVAQDATFASYALIAYASGLLSFMLVKVLATGFFSRQDTKRPVKYGIIAMVTNMVFNVIFAIPFGYVGLAIATALSGTVNALLLGAVLYREGVLRMPRSTWLFVSRVAISAVLMSLFIHFLAPATSAWLEMTFFSRVGWLAGLIFAGATVFVCAWFVLGGRTRQLKAA